MQAAAGGTFVAHVAGTAAGALYTYALVGPAGTVTRLDPYCRQLTADGTACTVIDPAAYAWQTPAFTRPARAASVVYELHVGSFTAAGTLAGATGWGYNPQLYFAPKAALGTADDLRAFVDAAHGLGIAVWLDVVYNHTDSWAQAPLRCFDGWCPSDAAAGVYFFGDPAYATTPWGPRPDYTQADVAQMIVAANDAWLGEMHGDGFRWDSVSNIRALDGSGAIPGGAALLRAANDHAHAHGAFAVAEDLQGDAAITQATSAGSGGFGFDAQWDYGAYALDAMLAETSDAARDLGVVQSALTGSYAGDPFARVLFVEDHDTVGNGGARLPSMIDPTSPESLFARRRAMLGGVLLMTLPGVPMLFMGQEQLATGTFASSPAPLPAADAAGVKMAAFYRDLIRLRRNLDGGAGGLQDAGVEIVQRNDAAKAIAYRRYGASGEDVVVLVNLANQAYTSYDIGVADAGPWRIRLSTDRAAYGEDFPVGPTGPLTATAGVKDGKPYTLSVPIGAYGAVVLTR
jgi:1,4-alpha-glucan branching enzyme